MVSATTDPDGGGRKGPSGPTSRPGGSRFISDLSRIRPLTRGVQKNPSPCRSRCRSFVTPELRKAEERLREQVAAKNKK
jgi:hypothetical protein